MMRQETRKRIIAKQIGRIGRHKLIVKCMKTGRIYEVDAMMDFVREVKDGLREYEVEE